MGSHAAAPAISSTDSSAHAPSAITTPVTVPREPGFVLYVEDNDDLRELVVELVTDIFDRRCVGIGSYEEMVALGDDALECSVAILDINLGADRRSGIDAYLWLRSQGFTGRVVFLTGHASTHPLVVEAQRIGDAEIFSKPIDADRLRFIVEGERR
jgi:DNA-binding NtrC family response regulator